MENFKKYIKEVLNISTKIISWGKVNSLPHYLRSGYRFYVLNLLSREFLLMEDRSTDNTPAVIAKQIKQVEDRTGMDVIYSSEQISFYNRKRLIEHSISFIVPGNQMYLPLLAIDLREHYKLVKVERELFSPATHILLLYLLNYKGNIFPNTTKILRDIGYSKMTVARSLKELIIKKVIIPRPGHGNGYLDPNDNKKLLWENSLPSLDSPILKKFFVSPFKKGINKILAGESALSKYSMIAEPKNEVFAFSQTEWKKLINSGLIEILPVYESEAFQVEVWKYDPTFLNEKGTVNRLSLYLSLKDNEDERIQQALDEMMESIKW